MPDSSTSVLLVDDHLDTVSLFAFALKQANFEVVPAYSVREASEQLQSRKFDLIILDLSLPDGTGIELSRNLRQTDQETPILFVSGSAEEKDKQDAIEAGAQVYLVKPVRVREMCATAAQLIGQTDVSLRSGL